MWILCPKNPSKKPFNADYDTYFSRTIFQGVTEGNSADIKIVRFLSWASKNFGRNSAKNPAL